MRTARNTPFVRTARHAAQSPTLPWLWAIAALVVAYLALRLAYLTRPPLFADEGTYLWWGQQLLRVFLSPDAAARVQQMHIVNGQNQTRPQMIARMQAAVAHGMITYLLMGSREPWTPDWQAALPQAVLKQAFDKPGGRDAALLFRLAEPD